jgi:predicted amidohydrolase
VGSVGAGGNAWAGPPEGWKSGAPRPEIAPAFEYLERGGPDGRPALAIRADRRAGLDGYWTKEFAVRGGKWSRFRALRRLERVAISRRSAIAELEWLDAAGRRPATDGAGSSQTECTVEGATDAGGWTEMTGAWQAPRGASRAVVTLHLRWAPGGTAWWSGVTLTESDPPAPRKVRLAAVHFKPHGGRSPDDNRRMFAPLIADAARQRADLVVLGECLTAIGNGWKYVDAAEPIPGPSTQYFGELARQHNLYIVAGLLEREGHLVYNTAALLAPDGSLAGKYRKVTLPAGEVELGLAPGDSYPVFPTRFGKLGIMICYDVFFPEVARQLAMRGAEVIAMPIYGGNLPLAAARAIDNHIYLVSSTYMEPAHEWMRTGVFDHFGRLVASAGTQGTVAVAEVDLAQPADWRWLGHFQSRIPHDRPDWSTDERHR